jgi:hypothetical protein
MEGDGGRYWEDRRGMVKASRFRFRRRERASGGNGGGKGMGRIGRLRGWERRR